MKKSTHDTFILKYSLINKWCWDNCIFTCKRIKLDFYLIPHRNINSIDQWYVRPKSIKLLEENIGANFYDLGFHSELLDRVPKAWTTKLKIDKMDFLKIKVFCAPKDTIKKVKKQPIVQEKYL